MHEACLLKRDRTMATKNQNWCAYNALLPDLCTTLPPRRRKMASRKIYIRLDQKVEQVSYGNCQMHISSVDKKLNLHLLINSIFF
jgi:hypothetical protein